MPSWLPNFVSFFTSRTRSKNTPQEPSGQQDPRYEPCQRLAQANITSRVWCEDVLACYGVPVVFWDLFLLVANPRDAAQALTKAGYIEAQANPRFISIPQLSDHLRLVLPPGQNIPGKTHSESPQEEKETVGVVLLPASDWNYYLPSKIDDLKFLVPDISEYFDHIVSRWMDLAEIDCPFGDYLSVHIAYIPDYIDEVWTQEFAGQVRREHRQLLFDLLATYTRTAQYRVELSDEGCWIRQRDICTKIIDGSLEPPSVTSFNFEKPAHQEFGTRVVLEISEAELNGFR
ncbi:hypothetical protein MauCBS54593_001732 [Microsporum audouinii]